MAPPAGRAFQGFASLRPRFPAQPIRTVAKPLQSLVQEDFEDEMLLGYN